MRKRDKKYTYDFKVGTESTHHLRVIGPMYLKFSKTCLRFSLKLKVIVTGTLHDFLNSKCRKLDITRGSNDSKFFETEDTFVALPSGRTGQ